MTSPHGILVDLLDCLVIIRIETYGPAEMIQVRPFFVETASRVNLIQISKHLIQLLFLYKCLLLHGQMILAIRAKVEELKIDKEY